MQVRPLRHWRAVGKQMYLLPAEKGMPAYGKRSYLTYDNRCCIYYEDGGWRMEHLLVSNECCDRMTVAGLLDTRFDRLCDAVEALEAVTEGIDE